MSSRRRQVAHLRKARESKEAKIRTRSGSMGSSRGGEFAGAGGATFLQPLPPDAPSGRMSPPPKVFDPSSLLRKRKRSGSLPPGPERLPKSALSPSPLVFSARTGLIMKSWLILGKMPLMNSNKRLRRRRRGRPSARRSSKGRRRKKSLR